MLSFRIQSAFFFLKMNAEEGEKKPTKQQQNWHASISFAPLSINGPTLSLVLL